MPDVPIVLTVLLALRYGPEAGCLTGFALGLAQDAVAGGPLGLHALSKALMGFVVGDLPRWILVGRPVVPVALAVVATVLDGLMRFALLQLFHYPAPLGELFARVIVPVARARCSSRAAPRSAAGVCAISSGGRSKSKSRTSIGLMVERISQRHPRSAIEI